MAKPRASKRKAVNDTEAASAKTPKQTSKDAIRVTRRSSAKEDGAFKTEKGSSVQTEPIKEKALPKSATKKNVVRETRHSSGSTKKGMFKASLNNDSPSLENVSKKTETSSPYDFLEDSVRNDSSKKVNQVKKKAKAANKTDKPNTKSSKTASSKTSKVLLKSKDKPVTSASSKSSNELPKESVRTNMPVKVKRNPLGKVPQLNLDDISPIVRSRRSNPSSISNSSKNKENDERVTRRSPRAQTKPVSASTSFIESVEVPDPNDSALFLSPRKTMPRFSTGKTSTPAEMPVKVKSRTAASKKVSATTKSNFKSTSTPYETKPKPERGFTGIKENISKLSPVPRTDTPTSDYASMDSIVMTPEPTPPVKQSRKRRGNSPAFTLDDDDDSGENLDLNKSVNKAYKKSQTKRKYEVSKHNTSKLDEWADKVNSELEDFDNFELSIEG